MGTNIIHSLCVSASVPLIAIKHCCLRVSSTLRICVHCRTPFYIAPPSGYAYIHVRSCNCVLQLLCWTSCWLSICLIDQVLTAIDFVEYCLLLCSRTTHAKLLTCYGYMMATRIFWRSQSVLTVLSYTGDYFFPLMSVYASCSSSTKYNIHFAFIN